MPRFAANLSMLYPELAFLDRFEAAARDGFEAVEFLFPYAWPAADIADRLRAHGLQQVLINTPPGGTDAMSIDRAWAAGDKGTACQPGREAEFRSGLALALDYAAALGCPRVHAMAGLVPPGVERARALATLQHNLAHAAERAAACGVQVLLEPINTRDIPGFVVNRQDEAHALVQAVGAPNLKVQMDLYHCQVVEGDVAMRIREHLPSGRIGHFQVAGVPQRHEPDIGELNCAYLFELIDEVSAACGWQGWLGCEYRPARGAVTGGTSAGLGWMRRWTGPGS